MFRRNKDKLNMAPAAKKVNLPSPSKIPRSRTYNVLSSLTPGFLRHTTAVVPDVEAQTGLEHIGLEEANRLTMIDYEGEVSKPEIPEKMERDFSPDSRTHSMLLRDHEREVSNFKMQAKVETDFLHPKLTRTSFTRPDLRSHAMLSNESPNGQIQSRPPAGDHLNSSSWRIPSTARMPIQDSPDDFHQCESPAESEPFETRDAESHDSFVSMEQDSRDSSPILEVPPPSPEQDDEPARIYEAQCSQYWSGRFVGLNDQFHSQTHEEQKVVILQMSPEEYSILFKDGPTAVNSSSEVYTREKRIFENLDRLCATGEARASLHAWQQDYARMAKNKYLLPPGGTMIQGHVEGLAQRFMRMASPRKSSAATFPPRMPSYGGGPVVDQRKASGPAAVGGTDPRIGAMPFGTNVTDTRIPTPTYAKTTRRNVSGQHSPQAPPGYEITGKHGGPIVLPRKTSAAYVAASSAPRPVEDPKRGGSFGVVRDTNSSTKPRPSLGMLRDSYSSGNLRQSLAVGQGSNPLNLSGRYQPRPSMDRFPSTQRGVKTNDSTESVAGKVQTNRPGLLRDGTVRNAAGANASRNTPIATKFPPPSYNDINATPRARKSPYLTPSYSMNFPQPPMPNRDYRNMTDTAYTTAKRALPDPYQTGRNARSLASTANDLSARQQSVDSDLNNSLLYSNLAASTPGHSGRPALQTNAIPSSSRQPNAAPHYYPPQLQAQMNQAQMQSSPRSEKLGQARNTTYQLVYEAADDDVDVWNAERSKPKVRKSIGDEMLRNFPGYQMGVSSSSESKDPYEENITPAAELGYPRWDETGLPYYLYDGYKKFYILSEPPSTVSGSSRVKKWILTEDREETYVRFRKMRAEEFENFIDDRMDRMRALEERERDSGY